VSVTVQNLSTLQSIIIIIIVIIIIIIIIIIILGRFVAKVNERKNLLSLHGIQQRSKELYYPVSCGQLLIH